MDPDRFLDHKTPGSQEWWYFDAISDDGRDAVVLVWYAALPFDPSYGVAALRHHKAPDRHPAPHPLDHCAVGMSWYREGRTLAYALNGFRRAAFSHTAEPFSVSIAGNALERDTDGYRLRIDTPAVDGKHRILTDLRFRPARETEPFERDLGTPESPHQWILAAPDCRVEGRVEIIGKKGDALDFRGRGYHDHNAGSEEISLAMRRWAWGRVHDGPLTQVYYHATPHQGPSQGLWITCHDGRPETILDDARFLDEGRCGNVFGIRHGRSLHVHDGERGLRDRRDVCVDDGPFYRRWVSTFEGVGNGPSQGISELLVTRNLHRPWFNWMIPYRLKRPAF